MNEDRGWSDDPKVVLRHLVVCWLGEYHENDRGTIPSTSDVARGLNASINDVLDVVEGLAADGLAQPLDGMDLSAAGAWLRPEGKAQASTWRTKRSSTRQRAAACRDALLDWLYDQNRSLFDITPFLQSPRAKYFGEPFTEDEAHDALAFLMNAGLAGGTRTSAKVVARPYIMDEGRACVERFESSVPAWQSPSQAPAGPTYTTSVSGSPGAQIMAGSPGGQQSSTVVISSAGRTQLAGTADQLIEALAALDLDEASKAEATDAAMHLRSLAQQPDGDKGRARALLGVIAASAATAAGTDGGQKLMHLIAQGMQAITG